MSTPSENILRKMNTTAGAMRNLYENVTKQKFHKTIDELEYFTQVASQTKQEEMRSLLLELDTLQKELNTKNPTGVLGPGNAALGASIFSLRQNMTLGKRRRNKKTRKTRKTRR